MSLVIRMNAATCNANGREFDKNSKSDVRAVGTMLKGALNKQGK